MTGLIPPLVTPLAARDELDHPGLARLLDRVIAGGVAGVFILGTTGEGPGLSYRTRYELVEATCEHVAGRVPVLVGVTDTSLTEALELSSHAANAGATAVVAAPPYYFPIQQADIARYYRQLVAESALPIFVYNMPACTKSAIALDTIAELTECSRILGVKDSGGDLGYFRQLLQLRAVRPDWRFYVGPEHLLGAATWAGGDGGVNGGAQLWPELFVNLFTAARAHDGNTVAQLQTQVESLGRLYQISGDYMGVARGLKCALSQLGVCPDLMSDPLRVCTTEERAAIAALLAELLPANALAQ